MYKDIFGKVDLFAPLLGDIEAIIPCSFDFDLEKTKIKQNIRPPAPTPKKVLEDNQTIIFFACVVWRSPQEVKVIVMTSILESLQFDFF